MKKLKIFLASIMAAFVFTLTGCNLNKDPNLDEEPIVYSIDFMVDNEVVSTSTVEEGNKVSKPENPSKTGYDFIGWYNKGIKFDFDNEVTKELDLVARFEAIQYDLVLNLDGGEIEDNFPLSSKYTIEDTITLPTVTKNGYSFVGWYDGNTKYEVISNNTGTKNLSARFELAQYDLVLDLDGGSIEGSFALSSKYTIGDTITLPTPTKTNYIFVGWKESNSTDVLASVQLDNATGNKNYKAIWRNDDVVLLYVDNVLYKSVSAILGENVLGSVDDLDETTTGWFKDEDLHVAVLSTDTVTPGMRLYTKKSYGGSGNIFTVSQGKLTIYDNGSGWNGVIPRKIDGQIITEIKAISNYTKSNEIFLPSSVIYTCKGGFFVKFGNLPNTIRRIGDVWVKTHSASSIEISKDNRIIGESAFMGMSNVITSITFETGSQLETIEKEAFYSTKITEIIIPSSVKTIGEKAFGVELTSVEFKGYSQLETIGKEAFYYTKITEIIIPSNVKTIGEHAFGVELTSVEFESDSQLETIGRCAFYSTKITEIVIPSSVKTIEYGAFSHISTLTSVTFETDSQLETIGETAFSSTSITAITIPSSVQMIGKYAFGLDLDTLTSIEFESGSQLETIGYSAFSGTKITEIIIPSSVKTIEYGAFSDVSTLTSVTFETGSQLETIGARAFSGTNISESTIPSTVKTIGGASVSVNSTDNVITILKENKEIPTHAFLGLFISNIIFETGSQLEKIGVGAFSGTNISEITIPSTVKEIGEAAFGSASALTSVTFETGSQLETIGYSAFYGTKITEIIIPSSVKTIEDGAFSNISTLTSVTFETDSQLETIRARAFFATNISKITIPSSVITVGEYAFPSALTSISFESDSQLATIEDHAFYATRLTAFAIPASVTEIGGFAFPSTLTSVWFAKGDSTTKITTIGSSAFSGTKITEIWIPDSVTTIESTAFPSTLTSVQFEVNSKLEVIKNYAFWGTQLETIIIPSSVTTIGVKAFPKSLTHVSFEGAFEGYSKLQTIGQGAFEGAKLDQTIIPSSVTTIGDYAFDYDAVIVVNYQNIYELIEERVLDVNKIYVLKTLTGANSYLEDNYDKTESGDYYVYTKKQQG